MINTYTLSIKARVGDRRHFPDTLGAEVIAPNTGEIGVERRRLLRVSSNWLSGSLLLINLCLIQ